MSLNQVTLIGNATADPEVKTTANGNTVAKVGLAVNEKRGDDNRVLYIDITFWNRLAEVVQQYVHRGSKIAVSGKLRLDQWEDKNSGQRRQRHRVDAFELELLSRPPQQERHPEPPKEQPAKKEPELNWKEIGDEVPF